MRIIILILVSFLFPNLVSALTIISPKQGTQILTGTSVKVQVRADAGEQLSEVKMLLAEDEDFQWNPLTGFYEKTIKSSVKKPGPKKIQVTAMDNQGNVYQAEVEVIVILPPSVTLQGIKVERTRLYLTKVPEGTKGAHFYETKRLRVKGQYSDGVERDVSNSATGTTYISSDEKITTVDTTGLVTAVGTGKAQITIKNGDKQVIIDVAVDQEK